MAGTLTVGSLFSGIGGLDLGLERAGMRVVWQVENNKSCQQVLSRHWPDVEKYNDIREVKPSTLVQPDLICGGFPCQDLSVAGHRAGLAGERSGLFYEFIRIIDAISPRWVLIENVPGLLSSNGGRDMGTVIGALAECGYGWAYRVLDAQFFGVAQRRRRVFIVGCLGNTRRAAEVLFESESLPGNPPTRQEEGQVATPYSISNFGEYREGVGMLRHSGDDIGGGSENIIAYGDSRTSGPIDVATTRTHHHGRNDFESDTFIWQATTPESIRIQENNEQVPTLTKYMGTGGHNVPFVGVRRLTPLECERLQGFPDGWTKNESDSARYRMIGNAVCVNVAEWIGRRIVMYHSR